MDGQKYDVPVDAVRVGPGQFLLATDRVDVDVDLIFATAGQTFRVITPPVNVGRGRYLPTVDLIDGPGGRRSAQRPAPDRPSYRLTGNCRCRRRRCGHAEREKTKHGSR